MSLRLIFHLSFQTFKAHNRTKRYKIYICVSRCSFILEANESRNPHKREPSIHWGKKTYYMHNESNLTTITLTRLTRSRSKTKIALHHVLLIVCSLKWKQTQISATYWPSPVFWWRTRDRTGRRSDPRAHVPWMKTDRPRGHRSHMISAWGHGPWTRSGRKRKETKMKYAERPGRKGNVLFNDTLNTFYLWLYGVGRTPRKEGNVLFNNALNTFYLRLYGVRHMVKDHSDSEKGNPLPPHRLLLILSINT